MVIILAIMLKTEALEKLAGRDVDEVAAITIAAKIIGCSRQAVRKWPDTLPPRIRDRVEAALYRRDQAAAAAEATHARRRRAAAAV